MKETVITENKHFDIPRSTERLVLKNDMTHLSSNSLMELFMLREIVAGKNNWYYKTVDGVLYTKDMKTLLFCPSLKTGEVIIPEGVEEVAANAFLESKITKVKLPDSMKTIRYRAFCSCEQLEEIEFGDGIAMIGNDRGMMTFYGCKSLTHLELPPQVKEIHRNSFERCEKLSSVKFNDELEMIDAYAFSSTNVRTFHIPDSVTKIGDSS